jgi:hypothetical protein
LGPAVPRIAEAVQENHGSSMRSCGLHNDSIERPAWARLGGDERGEREVQKAKGGCAMKD